MPYGEEDVGHQPNKKVRSFLQAISGKGLRFFSINIELFLPVDICFIHALELTGPACCNLDHQMSHMEKHISVLVASITLFAWTLRFVH